MRHMVDFESLSEQEKQALVDAANETENRHFSEYQNRMQNEYLQGRIVMLSAEVAHLKALLSATQVEKE